ncbi:MAG TPA: WD40 repeat domain-containing protein [Pirellulales bacterium]|nr:WD40 repeat domain-containing protein [Pirellulales bacterium]
MTTLQAPEHLMRIGFNPDGGRIAGHSWWDLTIWDPKTGEKIVSIPAKDGLGCFAFRPDGRQIAITGRPGPREATVRIHDAMSGQELRALKIEIKSGPGEYSVPTRIAYSPDGKCIATGREAVIQIWDATTGKEIRQLTGHQSYIWDLSFSPDGTHLASASSDRSARVWDVATGQQLFTLWGHEDEVTGVRFSPRGKEIATVSLDRTLRTWDATTGDERLTFRGHAQPIFRVDFDPKGDRIVTVSDDCTMRIWNSAEGRQYRTSPVPDKPLVNLFAPFGIDWSRVESEPDGLNSCLPAHAAQKDTHTLFVSLEAKRAVGLTRDGILRLWDTENGQELLVLKNGWQLQPGVLRPLGCFSPDGGKIALQPSARGWEERCDLEILDAATGALVCTLPNPGAVSTLTFSPDGKRVAGPASQQLRIWAVEAGHGRLDAEIEFKREPNKGSTEGSLAFSPNGRWIAWRVTGETVRAVRTLDLERGNKITELHGHRYDWSCLAFSPDSKRLVSVEHEMIKIWDVAAGQELLSLKPREDTHTNIPRSVSFSPDGRRLGCEYSDGRVTIWDSSLPEGTP